MALDPQLESYLATMDKALGAIPVSARADIITEIKSHVMEAQERDANAKLSSILSALGEPEAVANRYLLERGLKPGKAPRTPIIKWLTIGFVSTLGVLCFTMLALIWKFSPLLQVDEKNDHVVLLGGLIDVNGKDGVAKIGQFTFTDDDGTEAKGSRITAGSKELPKGTTKVRIPFLNGKINVTTSKDNQLHWNCKFKAKGDGEPNSTTKMEANALAFDFGASSSVKCDIEVPKNIEASIDGVNGKIDVEHLQGNLDVKLKNGKIGLNPDSSAKYKYELNVKNGRVAEFESSDDPTAFKIKVNVVNGMISNED